MWSWLLQHHSNHATRLIEEMFERYWLAFALAIFQARATIDNLRRFCPRRILATPEPAVCQQTSSISVPYGLNPTTNPTLINKTNLVAKKPTWDYLPGTAQVNTPNDTVIDLSKLKIAFFAKDTLKWILQMPKHPCDLDPEICRVRSRCRPYIDL